MATLTAPTLSDPFTQQGYQAPAFEVKVYDKAFAHVGFLGGYETVICTPRRNAMGSAEVTLRADHPRVAGLLEPGCRLRIFYEGAFKLSGRVELRNGQRLMRLRNGTVGATVTFHVIDDFQYLSTILGWPNPTGGITEQGAITKFYVSTGPAEDVVSDILEVNVDRLGLPITVPASSGRGATIKVKVRMDALLDKLFPKVDQAGLVVRVVQNHTGALHLSCYEPVVRTRVLTEESGVLVDWSWSQSDPTATRVVVAGGGEGTTREFRTFTDAARETAIGTVKELFVEARDIGDDFENALDDVPEKLRDLKEASNEEDKAAKELKRATRHLAAADAALELAEYAFDHRDAIDETGPGSDEAEFAAAVAKAQAVYDDALDDKNDATTEHNAKVTAQTAAQAAYDNAVDLVADLRAAYNQDMVDAADEALAAAGTKYGLSLTLAENNAFRYGSTFEVGDTVTVEISPGVAITDVVREVTITDTAADGLVVSPTVGDQEDRTFERRIARTVSSLLRQRRRQNAER